jgi:hypothetical protein
MSRLVIVLDHPSHWDALLPVLPWMREAGLEIAALRPRLLGGRHELRDLARALGRSAPSVRWLHALPRAADVLLIGTTDDLPRLRASAGGRGLVALPRSPVPATVLSSPGRRLRESAERSRATPAGAILCPGGEGSIPRLAERTGGLPFVTTGLPELDERENGAPRDAFVVLHPGDLEIPASPKLGARKHDLVLSRLLLPLSKIGAAIEVRTALHPRPGQDASAVIPIVRDLSERRRLPPEQLRVRSRPGWRNLREARAVLVLDPDDLLRAVAAGAERVWWLPFACSAREPEMPVSRPLAGCAIFDSQEYEDWIAAKAWEKPAPEATRVGRLLAPLSDGSASPRVAQVVLAAAAAVHAGRQN